MLKTRFLKITGFLVEEGKLKTVKNLLMGVMI